MQLTVRVSGEKEVSRKLLRFADQADDLTPAFRDIAAYIRGVNARQFRTSGHHITGQRWAPLKPATIARKGNSRILRASGNLQASLTSKSHAQHVEDISRDRLFVGTSSDKAPHHEYGAPRANIPQRKLVGLSNRDRGEIIKHIQAHLIEKSRRRVSL